MGERVADRVDPSTDGIGDWAMRLHAPTSRPHQDQRLRKLERIGGCTFLFTDEVHRAASYKDAIVGALGVEPARDDEGGLDQ